MSIGAIGDGEKARIAGFRGRDRRSEHVVLEDSSRRQHLSAQRIDLLFRRVRESLQGLHALHHLFRGNLVKEVRVDTIGLVRGTVDAKLGLVAVGARPRRLCIVLIVGESDSVLGHVSQ